MSFVIEWRGQLIATHKNQPTKLNLSKKLMKKQALLLCGMLWLGISTALCQTLLNSWENSLEGWSVLETATWTSGGFTTNGVTQGSYSWKLTATGVDYGPTLQGPSSTNLTLSMA